MIRWVEFCPECSEQLDVVSIEVTTPLGRPLATHDGDAGKHGYHCCCDHDCPDSFGDRRPDERHCECQEFHPIVNCRNACRKPIRSACSALRCRRKGATCSCDWCAKGQPEHGPTMDEWINLVRGNPTGDIP